MSQTMPTTVVNPVEPGIPHFEGREVNATHIKISGNAEVLGDDALVVSVDDRVHLTGDYKVVGVRHYVDKDGNLVREHVLKPVTMMITPWDPSDPSDDGVVRALRLIP